MLNLRLSPRTAATLNQRDLHGHVNAHYGFNTPTTVKASFTLSYYDCDYFVSRSQLQQMGTNPFTTMPVVMLMSQSQHVNTYSEFDTSH